MTTDLKWTLSERPHASRLEPVEVDRYGPTSAFVTLRFHADAGAGDGAGVLVGRRAGGEAVAALVAVLRTIPEFDTWRRVQAELDGHRKTARLAVLEVAELEARRQRLTEEAPGNLAVQLRDLEAAVAAARTRSDEAAGLVRTLEGVVNDKRQAALRAAGPLAHAVKTRLREEYLADVKRLLAEVEEKVGEATLTALLSAWQAARAILTELPESMLTRYLAQAAAGDAPAPAVPTSPVEDAAPPAAGRVPGAFNAHDLLDALEASGSKAGAVAYGRKHLEANPGATCEGLIAALEATRRHDDRTVQPGTIDRARRILEAARAGDGAAYHQITGLSLAR